MFKPSMESTGEVLGALELLRREGVCGDMDSPSSLSFAQVCSPAHT